jgi:hypothetical protein
MTPSCSAHGSLYLCLAYEKLPCALQDGVIWWRIFTSALGQNIRTKYRLSDTSGPVSILCCGNENTRSRQPSVHCNVLRHTSTFVITTTCDRPVENSIAAALSQQLVTDLLTGRCGPVRTVRYKASERIQISACWQQVLTDLLQICSDLREIGCVGCWSV